MHDEMPSDGIIFDTTKNQELYIEQDDLKIRSYNHGVVTS